MAIDTNDKKLSLMEDTVPEPAVVLNEVAGFDQGNRQQLVWGYPGILWAPRVGVNNRKLAHMEWCSIWEPALPVNPGVIDQKDKQQLLWGYPAVLWGLPPEAPAVTAVLYKRRRRM